MRIRRANIADLYAIIELERESPDAAHWSRDQYEEFFSTAKPENFAKRVVWVAEEEFAGHENVAASSLSIKAFLAARQIEGECELENVVVKPNARRLGLGTMLLAELVAFARNQGCGSIFLEVRESNRAARALYQGSRFEETGLRKNYYSNPLENAILYQLKLSLKLSHNETAP